MSNLSDFLIDNVKSTEETAEVTLPGRLKDFKFMVKPASGKNFDKWSQECKTQKKKRVTFNEAKFHELIISNCCVEPNFNDEEFMRKAGCRTPGELIDKTLLAGEIKNLANAIAELSGFDDDPDELVEEAKNS